MSIENQRLAVENYPNFWNDDYTSIILVILTMKIEKYLVVFAEIT